MCQKREIFKEFKILDIIAIGKGIFPYEKIISSDSLDIKPSGQFFHRTEFFIILKQQNVSNEDWKIYFYLWNTLEMRNLSDMNNIYNAQDFIKFNSVSTLCGSREREREREREIFLK